MVTVNPLALQIVFADGVHFSPATLRDALRKRR